MISGSYVLASKKPYSSLENASFLNLISSSYTSPPPFPQRRSTRHQSRSTRLRFHHQWLYLKEPVSHTEAKPMFDKLTMTPDKAAEISRLLSVLGADYKNKTLFSPRKLSPGAIGCCLGLIGARRTESDTGSTQSIRQRRPRCGAFLYPGGTGFARTSLDPI